MMSSHHLAGSVGQATKTGSTNEGLQCRAVDFVDIKHSFSKHGSVTVTSLCNSAVVFFFVWLL